ncbi:hypothetical protein ABT354_03385 [Streptomyces sp. NPDC000594]|uniref:hypothetical protein n=1 Tax=Streptomyces sp. NPDC000594 TaxID=3154261 RepID=UPI003316809E
MSNAPVNPAEIPVFTGDLTALDGHVKTLAADGARVMTAAGDVHSSFGGLSAFYRAPEAEQLFATTKPVTETASAISSDTCVIAGALGTYASEVRPLIDRFESLRADAVAFREKVSDDDKWREDGDLIEENLNRRNEVAEVWAQFQEAERNCHNTIVAIFCGSRLTVQDGSGGANQYGYDAEALKGAKSLPWGDAVEESVPAWQVWEHAWDFGKGVIVDGAWGTIKGLGTLVGFSGWEAAGQAWTGLGKLVTGLAITAVPVVGLAYWAADDKDLPAWLRDSRTAMKETGKALVAWDQWGSNPSRAAGAVTFNVVTTVFTGGTGGAVSGAGKAGAAGKVLSALGKTGRAIDPTTYVFKGAGAGLAKAGDMMAGLKNLGNLKIPAIPDGALSVPPGTTLLPDGTLRLPAGADLPPGATRTPEGTVRLPEGTVVLPPGTAKLPFEDGPARYIDESGNLYRADGTLLQHGDAAPRETPPAGADQPRVDTPSPTREPALATVGARPPETPLHLGSDLTDPRVPAFPNTADNLPGPGGTANNLPGGTANNPPMASVGDNTPAGGAANNLPSNSLDNTGPNGGTGSTPDTTPGRGSSDNGPGGGGVSSADNIASGAGRGDDGGGGSPGGGAVGDAARPGSGSGSGELVQRTAEEAKRIQDEHVRLANEDPQWRTEHYDKRWHRREAERIVDGQYLPKLTEVENGRVIATNELPYGPAEKFRPGPPAPPVSALGRSELASLDGLASKHQAYKDLGTAQRDFDETPTPEAQATLDAAKEAMGDTPNNTKVGENLGEGAARIHVVPGAFDNAKEIDLMDTGNGARRFDQLYRLDHGRGDYLIVEAKAPDGKLDWRKGAGDEKHRLVKQGSLEYINTILHEMTKRGGSDEVAAEGLEIALREGKVHYVMVKANPHTGTYAGAELQYFKIFESESQ